MQSDAPSYSNRHHLDARRLHQRNPSNSTRINIQTDNGAWDDAARESGVTDARYPDESYGTHATIRDDSLSRPKASSNRSMVFERRRPNQPTSTVLSPTKARRLHRRNLSILTITLISLYLAYTRYLASPSSTSPTYRPSPLKAAKGPAGPSEDVPVIDEKVFQKLEAMDQIHRWSDEDEVEQREADRLPYEGFPGALPVVTRIPDTKGRSSAGGSSRGKSAGSRAGKQADAESASTDLLAPDVVDAQYCPDQPQGCRFLLAAWIGEQETKAQLHLYQLGLLAMALNRTLVLPNVSRSRMMSCASQQFEFYYAPNSLARLGIPSVPFARFREWSRKRRGGASAQIISIVNSPNEAIRPGLTVHSDLDPSKVPTSLARKLCLEGPDAPLDFSRYSPVSLYPPNGWHKVLEDQRSYGISLVTDLSSEQTLLKAYRGLSSKDTAPHAANVLVINYELRYPILSAELLRDGLATTVQHPDLSSILPFTHFPYSSIWTELADRIVQRISPFVAVHWRQETLPPSIIEPCGHALIRDLERTLARSEGSEKARIRTVYLATDYPLEDLEQGKENVVPHSGTFAKTMTGQHHKAMRSFLHEFKIRLTDTSGIRLTTYSEEEQQQSLLVGLPKDLAAVLEDARAASGQPPRNLKGGDEDQRPSPSSSIPQSDFNLAAIDPGLLGIVDKAVAMRAQLFLTGQPWDARHTRDTACAKGSSFTQQIIRARRDALAQKDTESGLPHGGEDTIDARIWSKSPEGVVYGHARRCESSCSELTVVLPLHVFHNHRRRRILDEKGMTTHASVGIMWGIGAINVAVS